MRTGFFGVEKISRIRCFLGSMAVLTLGFVNSANADSYQCTFKPRTVERNLFPTSLRIDWPDYLRPARITGTIAKANGLNDVLAYEPIETGKRITFSWKLHHIKLPQMSYLFHLDRGEVDIKYTLVLLPASGKATLRASQTSSHFWSDLIIRTVGHCKIIS